ncbi:uncharacterized protein LOC125139157 [Tachysurus fulvidraco]|uniref:uncharacterized protein LOC125139157 n=1 Tax=Tachysurus fulvidraco TaxID=1234273 RepID=UPI001FEEE5A5|nr:uncharacterized protein LOC125139157 [Tachysurus fulvidraco]
MTDCWILIFLFSSMYTVHPGKHWVTGQSPTKPPIFQPDKELSVNIGDSATLRCCISENVVGMIIWFKQPKGNKPQHMLTVYKSGDKTFLIESQNPRFQIKTYGNCFNTTILKTVQSDEAMYYCARRSPYMVFGDGTYLQVKETSKVALCDNSVECESTLHGNKTNTNTQHNTVIGLGSALGLCALLIFCLTYFILRRRKGEKMKTSVEDSSGMMQESDTETLYYAALQFTKRKTKAGNRKADLSEDVL